MFCKKCGRVIDENASFCPGCGADTGVVYEGEVRGGNRIRCPKCGSDDCQMVVENDTTGGGYSAGNGCCGYILFGPLGLLCGLCGRDVKTFHRTYWVCKNCGRRFRA